MLRQRIVTALIAVLVLGAVLFLVPAEVARSVIAIAFVVAAWEWSGLLSLRSTMARLAYVVLVAAAGVAWFSWSPDGAAHMAVWVFAALWWSIALIWLFAFPTPIPTAVAWGAGISVLLPAYVALDWLYQQTPFLLLGVLVLVWLADIGAYFAGRAFGRVKLAPAVSPGKTWEGVIGGVAAVLTVAAVGAVLLGYAPAVIVPFCGAIALLSVVGDLTVSMFKRHAGVKDSGTLFPGHGGLLDRIDSVCAAAPLFVGGLTLTGIG